MSQGPNADTMARLDALMRQLNQVEASVGGRGKPKMGAAGIACIVVLVIVAVLLIGGGVCYSCRDTLAEYGFVLPAQLLGTSAAAAATAKAGLAKPKQAPPSSSSLASSSAASRTRAQLKQAVRKAPQRLVAAAASATAKARQNARLKAKTVLASANKPASASAPLLRPARRSGPAAASLMATTPRQKKQQQPAKKVSFAVNNANNRTLKLASKSLRSKPASTGLLGNARKALHTKDQILQGVRLSASQASTSARRTTQLASAGSVFSQAKRSISQVDPNLGLGRTHAQDFAVKRMREKLKAGQTVTPPIGAGQSQAWVAARDQVIAELKASGELPATFTY
jgi:hypothetical protein